MASDFWLSLTTNVGTMIMIMFIVDRGAKLARHWMNLQFSNSISLTERQILGPKPLLLTKIINEENTPT
jgi:hypothetical protein